MGVFQCEESLPLFGIQNGKFTVYELTPPGVNNTNIIRTDQTWGVKMEWDAVGPMCYMMCGKFHIKLFLEQWGGKEFSFPAGQGEATVPCKLCPGHYDIDIIVPAAVVPPGVFKLVISITTTNPNDIPGPVACFAEGPMITFFQPGPV